jgi:voltage-gated potassium channel
VLMLTGYGIIAVPTGIVTVELTRATAQPVSTQACPACGLGAHEFDAVYCRRCGAKL